jgi:ATP-dependent Clp protease ATP-binding subunit ClpA
LFIDEMHTIIARAPPKPIDASNIIKPALDAGNSGNRRSTLNVYRKHGKRTQL